jgi:hypothetical protein
MTDSTIDVRPGQLPAVAAKRPFRARTDDWLRPAALANALVLSFIATAVILLFVLFVAGGWSYYTTPLSVRAYAPQHRLLRPSGPIGQTLGTLGVAMMLVPVLYSIRKKWRRLARLGGMKRWLDVHIFCGTVGPVLVTFHSSLKFNGIISVAYWSMVAVVVSGFVGRYLYVRIPRTIRGTELSYEEILARAARLKETLAGSGVPAPMLEELDALERRSLASPDTMSRWARLVEPVRYRWQLRRFARALGRAGVDALHVKDVVRLAGDRALLLRRLAYLNRTRQLFAMWHVFHMPLVYVMFAIALVHIGVAVYLGYAYFLHG